MSSIVIPFIKNINARQNFSVRFICCDNAGENIALERECEKDGFGIQFEYTAPNTPQQNSQVERKFATLWGRLCTMLEGAQLSSQLRDKLWPYAVNTATDLDDCYPVEDSSQGSASNFFGKGYKLLSTHQKYLEKLVS